MSTSLLIMGFSHFGNPTFDHHWALALKKGMVMNHGGGKKDGLFFIYADRKGGGANLRGKAR